MDGDNFLADLARKVAIAVGLFVAGGVIAFGYSWRPLHGALTWKVEQLEARLDERNLENRRLRDELEQLRSSEAEAIDPERLAQTEGDLEKARRALAAAEKRVEQVERQRKDADSGAERWRKRY
ncbi:MAG: hypothetical protein KC616_21090, partial [Myxococcales bacterium]|nr:hypothetical protein [Myxococcales bacterium]